MSFVDVPAMADLDDEDHELPVGDLVDDPEVAGADTPLPRGTHQLACSGRPRVVSKEFDDGLHAATAHRIQLAQLPERRRGDPDLERHARPRSAFASAHGIGSDPGLRASPAGAASASRMSAMSSASPWRRGQLLGRHDGGDPPPTTAQVDGLPRRSAQRRRRRARSRRASEMLRSVGADMYKMYRVGSGSCTRPMSGSAASATPPYRALMANRQFRTVLEGGGSSRARAGTTATGGSRTSTGARSAG